jgi:predicted O-methyltransferase YrrM
MNLSIAQPPPPAYTDILAATHALGFTMASEPLTGALLRTLAATKPAGRLLELGTGTGLSTAWILAGMDAQATLVSVDNDPQLLAVAQQALGHDQRLSLQLADGGEWIAQHAGEQYDYIFADTWPGKYFFLAETLALLKPGGLYIIDDMLPQPNWPDGHSEKAANLLATLAAWPGLVVVQQVWASGIVVAAKRG